jgi:large subunit ribosomal protein L18
MAAALKGILDAGLTAPAEPESFPSDDRLKGEHLKVKNDVQKVKSTIDSEVKSA